MQTYQFDIFTNGIVDILAAEQTPSGSSWFQGTADAVRATLNHTTYYRTEVMLVLAGDHLYRMNYADLVRFHRESGARITVCASPVTREEAPEMGLLGVDRTGRIETFVEKPKDPQVLARYRIPHGAFGMTDASAPGAERYLASMGVYVFDLGTLREVLAETRHTDFGRDIIPAAIRTHPVVAYPFEGYWRDLGTIGAFYEANLALVRGTPPFALYEPRWPIYTRTRSLPPSRVIQSAIEDSLLVEGSEIVGATIRESIVGVRSRIREGSRLSQVVVLGADFYEGEEILGGHPRGQDLPALGIGRSCVIERAILDKNVRIGDNVTIRVRPDVSERQGENYWIRDGVAVIPKGAVIPSGTTI
jgi:glucose-1-phosphate adenylyltransferase